VFYLLYNLLSILLLIPVLFYHLYRSYSRGRSPALAQRLGFVPRMSGRPVIWLHAVSVGEAIAARPLLKALRAKYTDHALVVSVTTETGRRIVESFSEKDLCFYFPFDFYPAVWNSLHRIKPRMVIIMETEIWPNFMLEASRLGIPVVLANGRISDRSFERYLTFSWFFRRSLALFAFLGMQTEIDRERIIKIGAPVGRTTTCGNLKYDIPSRQLSPQERSSLRKRYDIPDDLLVFTAGSTHPGEEQLLLPFFQRLAQERHDLLFVLAPRHPERAGQVTTLVEQSGGMACRRRTNLIETGDRPFRQGELLLVDTVGELMDIYAVSDLVFVGGSLVATGGHNLLEPASLGIPSLFGPCMTNFREIAALTLQYGAGVQVRDEGELLEAARDFLASGELRQVIGKNGLKMVRDNSGATQRYIGLVVQALKQ
jgi:3-deoxy-D-manno-octulosonic-acid transferase